MLASEITQKWGVTPSIIHHISLNNFSISDYYRDCFSKYRLLYWSKHHFLKQLVAGVIASEGTDYIVIYHNCTRGKIISAHDFTQLALSFRAAHQEFNVPAYVLVSFPLK